MALSICRMVLGTQSGAETHYNNDIQFFAVMLSKKNDDFYLADWKKNIAGPNYISWMHQYLKIPTEVPILEGPLL